MATQNKRKIFLKCSTLLKAVTASDESDIGGIYISFLENIFRPKYIDFVQSVQIYLVYRYPSTSAKHFPFANTAAESVVLCTSQIEA